MRAGRRGKGDMTIDTGRITAQKADEDFELLLEEMASILDTEDDLTVEEDVPWLSEGDFHDLVDDTVDLGEEFFNLRDGPVVIGSPVVDPNQKREPVAPILESQEIQLVVPEPVDRSDDHVVHFRMTSDESRQVLSLDLDSIDDEGEEPSEPSLGSRTVRKRLGKLLALFREES